MFYCYTMTDLAISVVVNKKLLSENSFQRNLMWLSVMSCCLQVIKAGTVVNSSTTVTLLPVTIMPSVSTKPLRLSSITVTVW